MQDPALGQELNVRQLQVFDVRVVLTLRKHSVEEHKDMVHSLVITAKVLDFGGNVKLSLELSHGGLTDWCSTVQ